MKVTTQNGNQPGAEGQPQTQEPIETKPAGQAEGQPGAEGADDFYTDPEKVKAEIKKLRDENAKHRTKNKDLESKFSEYDTTMKKMKQALGLEDQESADPAEQAKLLQSQNEQLQVELGIAQLAMEHSIPADQQKYFRFLLAEKFESLGEGEELSDEGLAEVVSQVMNLSASKSGMTGTGVGAGSKPNADSNSGEVSLEQFVKMTPSQKSTIYARTPELYNKLFAEAKAKKML